MSLRQTRTVHIDHVDHWASWIARWARCKPAASGGNRARAALWHHHERQDACPRVRVGRSKRRVQRACRLEEGATGRHDLLGPMIDAETHLPVENVPEHGTSVTMVAPRTGARVQLEQHNIEAVERPRQRVSGELTRS